MLPAHNDLVIEYAGMPDVPEYMAKLRYKQKVYRANDVLAFYLYPDDLKGPRWPEEVTRRIYEYRA